MTTIVLGSGIAGISAGYHLQKQGDSVVIYERDNDWGGLCGNFTIDGFRFDKFVHFSFAPDDYTRNIFEESSPTFPHPPVSYNYWQGYWLKHPAQNNLQPLPVEEKVKIIEDFVNRPQKDVSQIENYEEWLRVQYGNYFAENFPFKYTRKYWGVEPEELETKWVGNRLHVSPLSEVLRGSYEEQAENFYYTKFMKYPKKGGFRSILNKCREGLDIRFNKEVVRINPNEKTIYFKDGTKTAYTRLISSLPLPEIVKMIENTPQKIKDAGANLMHTSGYMVSLGFKRPDVAKHLWFYIYDEDILPARVYSPNLKSSDNVPEGCSSLQAEIFFANSGAHENCPPLAGGPKSMISRRGFFNPQTPPEIILEKTIESLISMGLFKEDEIIVKDIRFEKYANVIFDKDIYKNREIVLDYLNKVGIESIGRFGKWEYMWTHQAFEDGRKVKNYAAR